MSRGRLVGEHVLVDAPSEANRIHNKGHFGTPRSGNGLRLELVEAAYLVSQGRLRVDGHDWNDLVAVNEGTEVAAIAYADLRDRGLVVRAEGDVLHVWDRGGTSKEPGGFHTHAVSERTPVLAAHLDAWVGKAVSVVDEDGTVTHYDVRSEVPVGRWRSDQLPQAAGTILHDRVVVSGEPAQAWHAHHIGTPVADRLVLSFTEAAWLQEQGVLDAPDIAPIAQARQPQFARTLPVYAALRQAGCVARSGFRFGTDLRAYEDAPDAAHARWLVQCVDGPVHWNTLSRGVRLAHGVRKDFLVACVDPVRFIHLRWLRP